MFPKGTPRILVSGCPMAVPNWKVTSIIEGSGGVVVGEESCIGERGIRNLTAETGTNVNALIDAIVERYFAIDCAVFTPNPDRLHHVIDMRKAYHADGVIHYAINFCQPYLIESIGMEKALEGKKIPAMRIETDYGMEDVGQLKTRIEAFLERIR